MHLIVPALAILSTLAAILWSSSLPLWLGVRVYSEQVLIVVLAASMAIAFLTRPSRLLWLDRTAALASVLLGLYLVIRFPVLSENVFYHPTEALTVALIMLVLLLEAVRRTMGWALIVILGTVAFYALFADQLTGPLQSRAIRWDRLATFLVLDSAALAGAALYIAVAVVVPFLILAQLLIVSGGSAFFSDLSIALTGRSRGGAGKIAIVGSALFGSVSGSAVSNVASTGSITIPLMKDGGYRPKTAGALEASASTGGQLMPPIMGASAFLLAENLQVPYSEVMLAALVPSILYYLSLFVFADLEAGRLNIAQVDEARIPRLGPVLRRGWFVIAPFVVLLGGLFLFNLRPETAALYAVLTLFLLSLIRTYEGGRIEARALIDVLIRTGRAAVEIVLICAIAGMIIGLFARSGLSFGMGFFLVQLGQSSLILLLIVTACVCILMGMGLPTVGVYLLLSTLAAPPLVELGLNPMAAHLFVLYFGMLSMLTPPVAIAAFVAANMAKAPPMATGFEAVRIAWPAFVVPFLFVASPPLLLSGDAAEILVAVISCGVGVFAITAAVVGFLGARLSVVQRVIIAAGGIAMIWPDGADFALVIKLVGAILVSIVVFMRRQNTVRLPE
ncbi:TRAP transporter fused permease subunit [Thalassococcus sp. S3]|uniref:TRAP transporter permease n=1 Tax=Thalassococcus sp. S3 TaxID=2017482 RepID=UPI00102476A5|nr:TRAP transporter fused permease subunit [Thalassococcus sp. S3]QBF31994.1 C4-dicarboxylate ABC transporter permease [Thalassococcus sp. S3]